MIRIELINEIKGILGVNNITEIYNSISTDDHKPLFKKGQVEVQEAIFYGYADIIGLTDEEFDLLKTMIEIDCAYGVTTNLVKKGGE